ncbi:hypothetical protein ABPG75_013679 [Micractinium tetrahymenae]
MFAAFSTLSVFDTLTYINYAPDKPGVACKVYNDTLYPDWSDLVNATGGVTLFDPQRMQQLQALICLNGSIAGQQIHDAVAAGGSEAAAAAATLAHSTCPASQDVGWERAWLSYQFAVRTVYVDNPLNTTGALQRQAPAWYHYNFPHDNTDAWSEAPSELPPLRFRLAGTSEWEPSADLQHPQFDGTTVPVLLVPEWGQNYGHTFGNSAAWLHANLHATRADWARRAALMVVTPLGLALPRFWQPLASQALVALNSPLPPSPVVAAFSDCDAGGADATCLRVLFLTRSAKPQMRQIENLSELLADCNTWRHTDPKTGQEFAATCTSFQPGTNTAETMAAVRSTHVIVGMHGAGMANAFFAKPGSAMMEVFISSWPWQVHRVWLDQEALPQLQWWALTLNDLNVTSPGELEARLPHPHLYAGGQGQAKRHRDRNVRIPWSGLDRLLQEHASVHAAGGMSAYLARRAAKERPVHYVALPGGVLIPGGTSTMFGGSFP